MRLDPIQGIFTYKALGFEELLKNTWVLTSLPYLGNVSS